MRNIQKAWGSSSSSAGGGGVGVSGSHRRSVGKMGLLTQTGVVADDDASSRSPGGPNSSFEAKRNSPPPGSFRKKKQGADRGSVEAIQFVPAYQESLSPMPSGGQQQQRPQESLDTSWDVIANDSHSAAGRSGAGPAAGRRRYSSSVVGAGSGSGGRRFSGAASAVVTPSPPASKSAAARGGRMCLPPQRPQPQGDDTKSVSAVSSANNAPRPGGSRIARLASLFSSRAVVTSNDVGTTRPQNSLQPATATAAAAAAPAPSPPASESSSAYVGWPGTQDKRGGTVVVESSYEESDVGVGVKDYQQEVEENVNREVDNWMNGSHCDSDSERSSPQRQPLRNQPTGAAPAPAAAAPATAVSRSPPRAPTPACRPDQEKAHRLASSPARGTTISPLNSRIHSIKEVYGEDVAGKGVEGDDYNVIATMTDPWSDAVSDISTSYSKTSSAYFNPREVQAIRRGKADHVAAVRQNRQAAATVMRRFPPPQQSQHRVSPSQQLARVLTEETLALKDHYAPPHRTYNASNAAGFRGLLHKTEDVPNLMDDVGSDSASSASAAPSRLSSANEYRKARFESRSTQQQSRQERIDEEDFVSPKNAARTDTCDDAESDVFDGISNVGGGITNTVNRSIKAGRRSKITPMEPSPEEEHKEKEEYEASGILGATSRSAMTNLNVALLGGGLTAIQTTADDFTGRKTASDFDDNLTNSDYDQYGFAKLPTFREMAVAGTSQHDRSLSTQCLLFSKPSQRVRESMEKHKKKKNGGSDLASLSESGSSLFSDHYPTEGWGPNVQGDLSRYYVHPEEMKSVVRKFRKMSRDLFPHLDYEDLEREEDATKAFALSEMRSRIMEKDIERGLERRGGTTVVDDIVLTPFNKAALRVRDAVIVAKAWRDGATPQDVINTSLLTRRSERTFCIPRPQVSARGVTRCTWEEVAWIDDMEMSQYRCHSIGPRHLKGTEMFTIGDCQSILLKLCNERCQELRCELNAATAQQIEAEEAMKEEGEAFDDGIMTEAEMTFLTSMEEVKVISHKLVLAEKAFTLVRDRIEKLVAKYEALLVRFDSETDSVSPSSIFTCDSSYYSEDYSHVTAEEREKDALSRRAQRAELRAELAAREAILAKQQVKSVREEKEKELSGLKARLAELQSESSAAITEREHSVVLARAITANTRGASIQARKVGASSGPASGSRISRSKIDDIKKRFRDRSAAKNSSSSSGPWNAPGNFSSRPTNPPTSNGNSFFRTVGEEMYQQLDFYERSLKAVEETR